MEKMISIVDCTLRDGSYAVNYSFTADDTRRLCAALQDAGVERIEIGHGLGLNGSSRFGVAAASDSEYCAAAAEVLSSATFGAFFIPGIGRCQDLDMARDYGMNFVRIGTNVTQVEQAMPFIAYAKQIGMEVSYNAMKSYLLPPRKFAENVRRVADWGADMVYVVDSAGCMLPDEVKSHTVELRERVNLPIGFHGHNNLMLANANCLVAYKAGAAFFDCTLQGIGRGGGNAQLEVMVALCDKLGLACGIDIMKVLCAGERLVRPLMPGAGGVTSLDVAMGLGGFHSSFLPRVERVIGTLPVDPKRVIIKLGEIDRLDPTEALIEEVTQALLREDE
jgi:4-hydroxy 2-oxovalerate aldolase